MIALAVALLIQTTPSHAFVLTGSGDIVEIQATGEKRGFSRAEFDRLFGLAESGCAELFAMQRAALGR